METTNKLYHIELATTSGLGGGSYFVSSSTEIQALRKLVFRLLRKKNAQTPRAQALTLADKIYENKGYKVLEEREALPENPKPFNSGMGETNLREIADDMDKLDNLKQDDDDDDEEEDDRMEKDAALKPRIIRTAKKEKRMVATVCLFRDHDGVLEVLLERRGHPPETYEWSLPGGHLDELGDDHMEDYVAAAVRELQEETGIEMQISELTYICDMERDTKRAKDDILFVGSVPMERSNAVAADDADSVHWTPITETPEMVFTHNLFLEKALQNLYMKQPPVIAAIPALPIKTNRGFLIVFEGIDGSGKSTQVDSLIDKLKSKDYDVVYSKWASSELLAEALKKGKKKKALTPQLYSLMNATDMVSRYEQDILPALAEGKVVVCDRYIYTSFVRDYIRGANTEMLQHIYEGFREPDVVLYCKVPLDVAFKRLSNAKGLAYYGAGLDLHLHTDPDKACQEYQRLMYEQYEEIMPMVKNCLYVDTTGEISDIADDIWTAVKPLLKKEVQREEKDDAEIETHDGDTNGDAHD